MSDIKLEHVSYIRWRLFLVALAVYMGFHFTELLRYAPELFSSAGVFPVPQDLPTYGFFPNILFVADSPAVAYGVLTVLLVGALLLPFRGFTLPAALLLWYGWAALLTRNPFIRNPGMPYVGWILLAIVVVTWWNRGRDGRGWRFPAPLFWWAWFFLGAGYTLSGFHKLGSPSWQEGLALSYLLENPLSRPGLVGGILAAMPTWFLKLQTWGALCLELVALPVMLLAWGRPIIWLLLVGMHLGIMVTVDFVDLTMGMIMIHLFVLDERWFAPQGEAGVLYFDGVCNLCNGFVDALIQILYPGALQIASLQGETAQTELKDTELPDSIVYYVDGRLMTHSDAIIAIGRRLGGSFRLMAEGIALIPRPLRDFGYRFVARNRYRLFGKKDTCRLPTAAERAFFLP